MLNNTLPLFREENHVHSGGFLWRVLRYSHNTLWLYSVRDSMQLSQISEPYILTSKTWYTFTTPPPAAITSALRAFVASAADNRQASQRIVVHCLDLLANRAELPDHTRMFVMKSVGGVIAGDDTVLNINNPCSLPLLTRPFSKVSS